ncbi:conserved hypothetical protein [Trichinella spiralis]|uniref:Uncharacterized protein n=1 Tax=Trichinella spiralis TaxID=6334 RepID=E5S8U5_TRISP|nr:conserved hypothetical protein [Trichinella spiralis]KRY41911.1 hypothetical protein T01_7191 [Trichinella spiralis]
MDREQDEKSFTSENMWCGQSTVQSCSISEERSILLSQAAIMDVVESLRPSNGQQRLTARQTWQTISGFQVGRRFKSFLEFEQAFDAWKSKHFHTFRVASSETLRLKNGVIDPIFRYRWSEHTLRLTTLHEEHSGHDVSEEAYKEFAEKSRRFGTRQNLANATRRLSAQLLPNVFANCQTVEAILNRSDNSDQENNDSAAGKSVADKSMAVVDGEQANAEKVKPSSTPRTDEDRFQMIHVVLQSLCDDLLVTEDTQLDEKLTQLAALHSQWQAVNL